MPLIKNRMAITPSPTKTQISKAMPPNIPPPPNEISMSELLHRIQVNDDSFGLVMTKKDHALGRLNADAPVPPNVRAAIADAADSIPTQRAPTGDGVMLNLRRGNRAQAKTQRPDLDAGRCEDVVEATQRQCGRREQDHADQRQRDASGPRRDHAQ